MNNTKENLDVQWGMEVQVAVCERCDWTFIFPKRENGAPVACPRCFQTVLSSLSEQVEQLQFVRPPELVIPFSLRNTLLEQGIGQFSGKIPFAPVDLVSNKLLSRLKRFYIPVWLVDTQVKAHWMAEVGFDYQVVSHQDRYDDHRGGWSSQQVREGRVRWEPRWGRLMRSYQNIPAPALEEDSEIKTALGAYDQSQAMAYQPESVQDALIRLPNRSTDDAWVEAQPAFQTAASEECRQASEAEHIRQFTWEPEYEGNHWTMLLQPMYSTYYLDDERNPQAVFIQGQTGRVVGSRRASMKRAQRVTLIMVAIAAGLILAGLLGLAATFLLPALAGVGIFVLVVGALIGLGALYPVGVVWWFNRQQVE